MQLTCPECHVECTVDEESVQTASCPGCGFLLYSKSGNSGPQYGQVAAVRAIEVSVDELEKTRQWQKSIDDLLPSAEQLPRRLDRYELKQLLGEGSFAQVYLAFDSKLARDVALKLPRRSRFSSAEQLAAFLSEAKIAAQLEHPGIVRVYDIGQLSEEICFISMEYCPGETLDQRLKQLPANTRLPLGESLATIAQVAEALHFAHLHGFVHRDLKPSNILFGRDGKPRIADFGLALHEDVQRDHAGEVAGTLPYMSPEQIRGDTHLLDGRTDIWSLGITLYQLLSGRRPFSGDRKFLVEQILKRDPKPLSQIDNAIPLQLDEICGRCLQRAPRDRFGSAKELAAVLHLLVDAKPGTDKTPSVVAVNPSRQSSRWKIRTAISAAVISAVLGISFAFGLLRSNRNELSKITEAEKPLVTQLANFDLEPTGVWHPLLLTKPREFFWEKGGLPWSYDSQLQRVTMSCNREGILELGEWSSTDYNLSLDLHRYAWSKGGAGVLWGIHEIEIDPKDTAQAGAEVGIRGTAFIFTAVPFPGQPTTSTVGIYDMRIWKHPNGRIVTYQKGIAEVPTNEPILNRVNLKLEIGGVGPKQILWDGRSLDELIDKFKNKFKGEKIPSYQSKGRMGIINFIGSTTFSGVQVQLNNKKKEDKNGQRNKD